MKKTIVAIMLVVSMLTISCFASAGNMQAHTNSNLSYIPDGLVPQTGAAENYISANGIPLTPTGTIGSPIPNAIDDLVVIKGSALFQEIGAGAHYRTCCGIEGASAENRFALQLAELMTSA